MTKKNPMLGMWLTTNSAWTGAARSRTLAEMRRSQAGPPLPKTQPAAKRKRPKKGK